MKPPYVDLYELEEDERIKLIAHRVVGRNEVVGVLVDIVDGSHAKGDRYIAKLKKLYPQISVISRIDGPAANVETIKVGGVN